VRDDVTTTALDPQDAEETSIETTPTRAPPPETRAFVAVAKNALARSSFRPE
jgi:hypothetical protein